MMLILIVIVFLGLVFNFLSIQNTATSTVYILGYSWTQPIYIIVFCALLIGFFISWIVSSINALGTWYSLHGKDSKIREAQKTVIELEKKIRELELENAKLQGRNDAKRKEEIGEVKTIIENKFGNFLNRFRNKPA